MENYMQVVILSYFPVKASIFHIIHFYRELDQSYMCFTPMDRGSIADLTQCVCVGGVCIFFRCFMGSLGVVQFPPSVHIHVVQIDQHLQIVSRVSAQIVSCDRLAPCPGCPPPVARLLRNKLQKIFGTKNGQITLKNYIQGNYSYIQGNPVTPSVC